MSTTSTPRAATAGMVGGALWALLPVAWSVATIDDVEPGSLGYVAVAASYWIFLVLPPALIVVGLRALRRALGADPGRVGQTGMALTAIGLGAMALGNGIEVASITTGGGKVALGHVIFLAGFLVAVIGSLLLGVVVFRRRRDALSRAAGLLLALAFPLAIGIGFLGSAVNPDNEAWFWAAISVPMGIAWVLLGRSLAGERRGSELTTASA